MRVTAKRCPPPWRCQYDNTFYPGGSCNLTSAFMIIEHYYPGKVKNPDVLLKLCDQKGWDRHELEVIDRILEMHGVADNSGYNFTMEQIKKHIQGGDPVIIQGEYTRSGHILVVWGYDTDKGVWLCNDPAGRFDIPNNRYDTYASGKGVEYPSDWFRAKSAPDGKVWAHLVKKKVA